MKNTVKKSAQKEAETQEIFKPDLAEKVRSFVSEWAVTIILLLFGTTTLVQAFVIPTGSMEDNLLIGDRMAEEVKIAAGSAYPLPEEIVVTLRGRDLVTGLPKTVEISSVEIREAIASSVNAIVETVKEAIEETPPELVADLMAHGIVLAGGGALLKGLDQRLAQETKMRVYVADDPLTCVARGCGEALEEIEILRKVEVPVQYARPPRRL